MDIIALVLFSIPLSFSPGPNNLMVLASGVNFGYKKTIPHMLGISCGLPLMIFILSFGFVSLIEKYPEFSIILQYIGGAYLCYLAWKIANAQPIKESDIENNSSSPMTFIQAVLFQWVNPKAWVIAVNVLALFINPDVSYIFQIIVILFIAFFIGISTTSFWTTLGTVVRKYLSNPLYNKIFNISMALLLVLSFILSIVQ